MKKNNNLKFIFDSLYGYKLKIVIYFISVIFVFYIFPLFITPYILSLFGNIIQKGELTVEYAVVLSLLYTLSYTITELSRFLYIEKYLWFSGVLEVEKVLMEKLFGHTIYHSMNYYNNQMSGILTEKIKKISRDVVSLADYFPELIGTFISIFLSLIIFFKINVYLTVVFFVWSVLFSILYYFSSKSAFNRRKETIIEENKINGIINDDIVNIYNIKSFSKKLYEKKEIKKQNIIILQKTSKELKAESVFIILFGILMILLMFFILGIAFYLVIKKEIFVGTFVFLCQNIILLQGKIHSIFETTKYVIQANSEIKEGLDTLLKDIEIKNKNSTTLQITEGKIIFKNIRFSYNKKE